MNANSETFMSKSGFLPPKIVWMSIKDHHKHDAFEKKAIRAIPDDYELIQYDDADCYALMEQYPKYIEMVKSFKYGVMRSDFCRYMYIYHHGGVYIDSDVVILNHPSTWSSVTPKKFLQSKQVKMVVGLEFYKAYALQGNCDPFQNVQWAFAAYPNHPVLMYAMEDIYYLYQHNRTKFEYYDPNKWVYELTGPGAMTRATNKYLYEHGGKQDDLIDVPVLAGDLYIGQRDLFNCISCSGFTAVQHLFGGRWKSSS